MSKIIITISRQYGSGGRVIGKRVAEQLNIPFYDKELIELASQKSGIHKDHFEEADEQANGSLLYSLAMGMNPLGSKANSFSEISLYDRMFLAQTDVIRSVAQEGSCVIVGRCADYVLRGKQPSFNVFIHANIEQKIERICKRYSLDKADARNVIIKTNRKRRQYYHFYADDNWGKCENYHLCVDSSAIGIESTSELIVSAASKFSGI